MIAFIAWVGLSTLWSASPGATSEKFFTEMQCLFAALLMWQFTSEPQQLTRCIKAYVLGTFVASGSTITRFMEHRSTSWDRYSATGFDPNDLSLTLALTIPMSYWLFLQAKPRSCVIWLTQIVAGLAACLLTASRMGFVVSVLALSIALLTIRKTAPIKVGMVSLAVIAGALVLLACVPASAWQRLLTIKNEITYGTLDDRTAIWGAGFQAFSAHPVMGVGAGAFAEATDSLLSYPQAGHMYVAHNLFISISTELGLVGISLFAGILWCVVGPLFRLSDTEKKVWLLTFVIWVVGVSTLSWEHRKPTWIILTFMIHAYTVLRASEAKRAGTRLCPNGGQSARSAAFV
jgi:O-antigen ligase